MQSITLLLVICIFSVALASFTNELHVSTAGNDEVGTGALDSPFASLVGARNAIRALKREQGGALKQPVTVYLHPGKYFLQEPFVLEAEDSSFPDTPITYHLYCLSPISIISFI